MASKLELIASLSDTHKRLLASLSQRLQDEEEDTLSTIIRLRKENDHLRGLLESHNREFSAETKRIEQEAQAQEEYLQRNTATAIACLEAKAAALLASAPVDSMAAVDSWAQERDQRQRKREEVQLTCITAQRELDLLKSGPLLTKERIVQALRLDLEDERMKFLQGQRSLEEKTQAEEVLRAEIEQKAVETVRLQQRVASDKDVLSQQSQDLRRLRRDKEEAKAQVLSLKQALDQAQAELSATQAHFGLLQAQYSALHTRVRGLTL